MGDTVLAGLANYIDAGSIVAASVALALWQESFRLSEGFVGALRALGPDALNAGIGALIGTALRAKAPGLCFAIVRIALGVFSFFVPMLKAKGLASLAWSWTGLLVTSGVIGWLSTPRNDGKSLEQLDAERQIA